MQRKGKTFPACTAAGSYSSHKFLHFNFVTITGTIPQLQAGWHRQWDWFGSFL